MQLRAGGHDNLESPYQVFRGASRLVAMVSLTSEGHVKATSRLRSAGALMFSMATSPIPRLKLYWCATVDHDEDWFIVERTKQGARRHFIEAEGYAPDDEIFVQLVMPLPAELQDTTAIGWPSDELLGACGGIVEYHVEHRGPRFVNIAGHVFHEGGRQAAIEQLEARVSCVDL